MMDFLEGTLDNITGLAEGAKSWWERKNRYASFAPEREDCHVKWYVDAKDYFYAVSEALMSAKEEIFIEDLWLTPELVYNSVQRTKFFAIFFYRSCGKR
jgi:hypothetical protein